jgi:hypothetical protein
MVLAEARPPGLRHSLGLSPSVPGNLWLANSVVLNRRVLVHRRDSEAPQPTIFVLIDLAGSGDDTGYKLFSAPGNYLLDVEVGGTPLGSAVVTVHTAVASSP